jgi:hypothetical protein
VREIATARWLARARKKILHWMVEKLRGWRAEKASGGVTRRTVLSYAELLKRVSKRFHARGKNKSDDEGGCR